MHKSSKLAVIAMSLSLSACGLFDMPNKMDDTNGKIDKTNHTTEGLSSKITTTNETAKELGNKLDRTNQSLDKTESGLHKQTLLVALKDMFDPEHTKSLVPVPFGMFAGGKTFAEELREDEVVDWFYAETKDIKSNAPDESQKILIPVLKPAIDSVTGSVEFVAQYDDRIHNGHKFKVPQTEWAFPIRYVDSFNNKKDIMLNAMQVVAGFLPQSMMERLVQDEIANGGIREQTVYLILDLRDQFKRGALLKNSLFEDRLKNFKQYKEAFTHVFDLEYIAELPYAKQIQEITVSNYANISVNYVYSQLVKQSDLALVQIVMLPEHAQTQALPKDDKPVDFKPVKIEFDSSQPFANPSGPMLKYFSLNDDGSAVVADQSDARNQSIAYDPSAVQKDWKTLDLKFTSDLPKADQSQSDAVDLHKLVLKHVKNKL